MYVDSSSMMVSYIGSIQIIINILNNNIPNLTSCFHLIICLGFRFSILDIPLVLIIKGFYSDIIPPPICSMICSMISVVV